MVRESDHEDVHCVVGDAKKATRTRLMERAATIQHAYEMWFRLSSGEHSLTELV